MAKVLVVLPHARADHVHVVIRMPLRLTECRTSRGLEESSPSGSRCRRKDSLNRLLFRSMPCSEDGSYGRETRRPPWLRCRCALPNAHHIAALFMVRKSWRIVDIELQFGLAPSHLKCRLGTRGGSSMVVVGGEGGGRVSGCARLVHAHKCARTWMTFSTRTKSRCCA